MLKICLFFAIFEPRDAYKGDAWELLLIAGLLGREVSQKQ